MTDPRNIAHDKKIQQEKKHRGEEISPGAEKSPQPGRKPHIETVEGSSNSDAVPGAEQGDTAKLTTSKPPRPL